MSTFTDQQIGALTAPLAREHVKGRKQAGRNVSYIEGWHAIAEANRIFGFDAWDRELVDFKCVSEKPCVIGAGGQYEKPGFRVAYIGKVRVTVRAGDKVIVREGAGYGSGIDADVGEAHESAIKEMETDSMKRALMTFGNPFGLALYDKAQTEVAPAAGQRAAPQRNGNGHDMLPPHPEEPPEAAEARAEFKRMIRLFREATTPEAITDDRRGIWAKNKETVAKILRFGGDAAMAKLNEASQARLDELQAAA